jgi:hypothetical protein
MDTRDDFPLWEAELRPPADEPGHGRGILAVAIVLPLAFAALVLVGQAPLGIAAFVISVLILVLWYAGM